MTMDKLPYRQCKEFLKRIKDLEISCYQQEQLLKRLKHLPIDRKDEIRQLENKLEATIEKPTGVIGSFFGNAVGVILMTGCGVLCGAIIATIIKIIVMFCKSFHLLIKMSSNILDFIWNFIFEDFGANTAPWLQYVFWGSVICGGVALVAGLFTCGKEFDNDKARRASYPQKLKKFQSDQRIAASLIERKKHELAVSIPNEIAKAQQTLNRTRQVLEKYYSLGVIHPGYYGLVPICTLYEYLESGRCFSLTGHEGAYNLYESELRMNIIIGKLDDIIDRLDAIADRLDAIAASQRVLANEIKRSNQQVDQLSHTLNKIEQNTALSAYYDRITAADTTFLSWLATLRYDKKGK